MNNAITKELRENGVMVLTLNRPEVLNAMNKDLIMGLYEIFQEIEKENDSRVIIITGEGRGFCAVYGLRPEELRYLVLKNNKTEIGRASCRERV